MSAAARTLDQKRAAHALSQVRDVDGGLAASYRSYVESLAATIVTNGLGQACATLLARASGKHDAHRLLYDDLQEWLCRSEGGVYGGEKSLLDAVINGDQRQYVYAQAEALAYLDWLKKFAQAFLKQDSASASGANHAG
jgi:CRISPR-associated protein Cmr5